MRRNNLRLQVMLKVPQHLMTVMTLHVILPMVIKMQPVVTETARCDKGDVAFKM
jgi:hypothetical protein